jgi:hypothetical protein
LSLTPVGLYFCKITAYGPALLQNKRPASRHDSLVGLPGHLLRHFHDL